MFGRMFGDPHHAPAITKRANRFLAESIRHRPGARTAVENLYLSGDWTDTGLPDTIEGAIRSGETAAAMVLSRR
jgi:uncharacterized protein with NAD-binding domain and iron-sulfur cluster